MEVITMRGGFRGLGLTSASEADRLLTWFNSELDPAQALADRLYAATSAGQLPTASGTRLSAAWTAIRNERERLTLDLPSTLDLPLWQQSARNLAAQARAFMTDARAVLGDEAAGRGLRLTLLAVGSVAALGGLAWVIYRYGKRKHPGSRRRRRR